MRDKYLLHNINEMEYGMSLRDFLYTYKFKEMNILDVNIIC